MRANCCWFLSDVRRDSLPAKKPFIRRVGRLTSTLGRGSASPAVTVRSTPASFSRYATAWSIPALTRVKLSRMVWASIALPAALPHSSSAAGPVIRQRVAGLYHSGFAKNMIHCRMEATAAMAGMVSAVLPRRMLISPARPPSIVCQHRAALAASRISMVTSSGLVLAVVSSGPRLAPVAAIVPRTIIIRAAAPTAIAVPVVIITRSSRSWRTTGASSVLSYSWRCRTAACAAKGASPSGVVSSFGLPANRRMLKPLPGFFCSGASGSAPALGSLRYWAAAW